MSDYVVTTDFSVKDGLTTGDANKLIKGSDFDTEFDNLATAIGTKYDSDDLASSAEAEAETSNVVLMTPLRVANWADYNAGMVGDMQAITDPGADGVFGWDESTNTGIMFTLGDGLEFSGTTIRLEHLGIGDLEDPAADSLMGWDDSGSATAWFTFNNGLEFSGTATIGIVDIAAGAAQPVTMTSGTIGSDYSSITTIGVSSLNVAEDGMVMSDNGVIKVLPLDEAGVVVVNATDAIQTFDLADANTMQILDGTTTRIWTIPANSAVAFEIGATILLQTINTAEIDVHADTGVVLTSQFNTASATETTDTVAAGGRAALIKVATDEWTLAGDIAD